MKKSLSILLALIVVLSVLFVFPISVNAAYAGNAQNSGYDCVAYAKARFQEIYGFSLHGTGSDNAQGYYYNANNFGDTVSSIPAVGALSVWGNGNVGYSHVAIVEAVDGSNVTISEGGYDGHYNERTFYGDMTIRWSGNYQNFLGYVYVAGTNPIGGDKPYNPWMSASADFVLVNSPISFYFGAELATYYDIGIDRNNSRIITQRVTSGHSFTFGLPGYYTAYVSAGNDYGYVDSSVVYFYVLDPCDLGESFSAHIITRDGQKRVTGLNNANVSLNPIDNQDDQIWTFKKHTSGAYTIQNNSNGEYLCLLNGNAVNSGVFLDWSIQGDAGLWYIRTNSKGLAIVPKGAINRTLDTANGQLLINNTSDALTQFFNIDYVDLAPSKKAEYHQHIYEYYPVTTTWTQAYTYCQQKGGHLVSISSAGENDFIFGFASEANRDYLWLGATDMITEGEWTWTTGEAFDYQNWDINQPDNSSYEEHYVAMCMKAGDKHSLQEKKWNDMPEYDHYHHLSTGFICEYEIDDIEIDNYAPSRSVLGTNSHLYEFYSDKVCWDTAKRICETKGGHLLTIESADENEWIRGLVTDDCWIGITDQKEESVWLDINGNEVSYSNWSATQPDNCVGEDYGELYQDSGTWNDNKGFQKRMFICEYETLPTEYTPDVTQTYNNHRYELFNIKTDWKTAEEFCKKRGGHLATVTSKEENTLVWDMALQVSSSPCIWLGGSDDGSEGNWYWTNGEEFSYSNWISGQPDNYGYEEHYLHMYNSGVWNDYPLIGINYNTIFVCEYDVVEPDAILGDADGDGDITSIDAAMVMRANVELDTGIDKEILMNGDVDGNDALEIIDATFIQRYLALMDVPFAIGEAKE